MKVGDKVRVITTSHEGWHKYNRGDIVTITSIDLEEYEEHTEYKTEKCNNGVVQWLWETDIEEIEEK